MQISGVLRSSMLLISRTPRKRLQHIVILLLCALSLKDESRRESGHLPSVWGLLNTSQCHADLCMTDWLFGFLDRGDHPSFLASASGQALASLSISTP